MGDGAVVPVEGVVSSSVILLERRMEFEGRGRRRRKVEVSTCSNSATLPQLPPSNSEINRERSGHAIERYFGWS